MKTSTIHNKCRICGKVAVEVSSKPVASRLRIVRYTCGHTSIQPMVTGTSYDDYVSKIHSYVPRPFQIAGMRAVEANNFRFLLADEMGLGKTLQALVPIALHPDKLTPFVIFCKSQLRVQMFKAVLEWLGEDYLPQIVDSKISHWMKGCKGYVVSFDLFKPRKSKASKGDMSKFELDEKIETVDPLQTKFDELGIQYVILDECQHIKNSDSKRTMSVKRACKNVPHIVALSGTPIKNHAGEYFPVLNLLSPEKFPKKTSFDFQWVDTYWDGYTYKQGAIRNPEAFANYTKDLILRRTRKEVMPELPECSRNYQFNELGTEVENMYKEKFKKFQDEYFYSEESAFQKQANLLAYIAEMRYITGMAKVEPCVNFVADFLLETDRKIVIFVHHIDVGTSLCIKLQRLLDEGGFKFNVLRYEGGGDKEKQDRLVDTFAHGPNRIMVASTLSAGEGLDKLQICCDFIMLERQWNPANEEQAEGRFIRIGQESDKVFGTYFIATGTVDEFFTELVEQKRAIVKQTLDGEQTKWNESALMRELTEILALKGGKKWGW